MSVTFTDGKRIKSFRHRSELATSNEQTYESFIVIKSRLTAPRTIGLETVRHFRILMSEHVTMNDRGMDLVPKP